VILPGMRFEAFFNIDAKEFWAGRSAATARTCARS
jgi:hypothetical protein